MPYDGNWKKMTRLFNRATWHSQQRRLAKSWCTYLIRSQPWFPAKNTAWCFMPSWKKMNCGQKPDMRWHGKNLACHALRKKRLKAYLPIHFRRKNWLAPEMASNMYSTVPTDNWRRWLFKIWNCWNHRSGWIFGVPRWPMSWTTGMPPAPAPPTGKKVTDTR